MPNRETLGLGHATAQRDRHRNVLLVPYQYSSTRNPRPCACSESVRPAGCWVASGAERESTMPTWCVDCNAAAPSIEWCIGGACNITRLFLIRCASFKA